MNKDHDHVWRRRLLMGAVCVCALGVFHSGVALCEGQGQDAKATAPKVTEARMDLRHPFKIGSDYYPQESIKNHEEGKCIVSGYVGIDGAILAAQILKSTGYPRLDVACFLALDVDRAEPATIDGVANARWSPFRMTWKITPSTLNSVPPQLDEFSPPRFSTAPRVGGIYYPAEARAKHQQGMCLMHAKVGADGEAGPADILKSTGSKSLDQECIDAMMLARYIPERRNGVPVDSSVLAALFWRLQ